MSIAAIVAKRALRRGDTGQDVRAVQLALRAAGHELVIDGDYGRITVSAVADFQVAHRLHADGVVGPITGAALDLALAAAATRPTLLHETPLASAKAIAPWLSDMRAITGVKEVAGPANSPVILSWVKTVVDAYPEVKDTVGWYNQDSIPWCGLGMAYCMAMSGKRPPRLALGALNWRDDWQDGEHLEEPVLGAIMVKTRAGGGHVSLYEGEDAENYFCRGANQSDMVNVATFPKSTPFAFMWPKGEPPPQGGRVFTTFAGAKAGSEA